MPATWKATAHGGRIFVPAGHEICLDCRGDRVLYGTGHDGGDVSGECPGCDGAGYVAAPTREQHLALARLAEGDVRALYMLSEAERAGVWDAGWIGTERSSIGPRRVVLTESGLRLADSYEPDGPGVVSADVATSEGKAAS